MKYKFSPALEVDYRPLKDCIAEGEELTKDDVIEKCSGKIPYELLQFVKELEFTKMGKENSELYLI
jgi:hypothetical protein